MSGWVKRLFVGGVAHGQVLWVHRGDTYWRVPIPTEIKLSSIENPTSDPRFQTYEVRKFSISEASNYVELMVPEGELPTMTKVLDAFARAAGIEARLIDPTWERIRQRTLELVEQCRRNRQGTGEGGTQ